jgi:hypothetical protein
VLEEVVTVQKLFVAELASTAPVHSSSLSTSRKSSYVSMASVRSKKESGTKDKTATVADDEDKLHHQEMLN